MKKLTLAATGIALLLSATPLTAAHRRYAECRIVHPSYYYESLGRRGHGKYRARHFTRYHAPRFRGYDRSYRSNRSYRYRGPYRFDYRRPYYQPRRGYHHPRRWHRGHRPRIGIYFEF